MEKEPKTVVVDEEEADEEDEEGESFGPLFLGPPFAFESGVALVKERNGTPACAAVCQCNYCGQLFRIDLLDGAIKNCPQCHQAYSHCLIVAEADDDSTFEEAIDHVLIVNKGIQQMAADTIADEEGRAAMDRRSGNEEETSDDIPDATTEQP